MGLAYDLVIRMFHFVFSIGLALAFVIAKTADSGSGVFPYHMLLGLLVCWAVLLRLTWGVMGRSHTAGLTALPLNPLDLVRYLRSVVSRRPLTYFTHNPASAWAALGLVACALGLGATGLLMTIGKDAASYEDPHEWLANGFLILSGAHLLGLMVHAIRHRDKILQSMLTGKKHLTATESPLPHAQLGAGIAFSLLILLAALHLWYRYDPVSGTLDLFGATAQLGEGEAHD